MDRRTLTSRANLGDHIPEALDPTGTVVVAVRLPRATLNIIDAIATDNGTTRSRIIRALLDDATNRAT